jgi:ankyrin repeat protein
MNNIRFNFTRQILHRPLVILVALAWSSLGYCGDIHNAAMHADWKKVKELLKDNPDLALSKDEADKTLLHYASTQGETDVVEFLLAHKAEVDATNNNGETPLHAAASSKKYTAESSVSVAKGSGLSKATNGTTLPAIIYQRVIEEEHPLDKDVAGILLAKGADVNAKDKAGKRPLGEAVSCDNKNVAEFLRQHGGHE